MNTGDAFLIALPEAAHDTHLWILIFDPCQSDEAVIVNLTTFGAGKDDACVLDVGDHPFVRHRTCVYFAGARKIKTTALEFGIQSGQIVPQAPVSPAVLDRILEAIPRSKTIPLAIAPFLADQGMIEL